MGRWEDAPRVDRAAMRHDLEEALQVKIDRAVRDLTRAVNTKQPVRVRAQLARRVDGLRALLKRAEALNVGSIRGREPVG